MKKLATLTLLASMAMSAQAASILWGFGGQVYLYDGKDTAISTSSSATVDSGAYLALVYLGQNVTSFSVDDVTSDMAVDKLSYSVVTSGKGTAVGKWNPNTSTYADSDMASGASFTVLFYNGSSFDYVYALSGSEKGAAYNSNIVTVTSDNMVIANSTIYGTGSATGAGVVAVPEPGVAALALLGIGMLIKRRRA